MEINTITTELKSHFLRLYQIALSDGEFGILEIKMLYQFAEERGISREHLDEILLHPIDSTNLIPTEVNKRLEYLYDFTAMAWADGVITEDEKVSLEKYIRLFGFLDENVLPLSKYLIESVGQGKSKLEIIQELNS